MSMSTLPKSYNDEVSGYSEIDNRIVRTVTDSCTKEPAPADSVN